MSIFGKRVTAVKHRRVHCPKTNEEIEVWVSMTLDARLAVSDPDENTNTKGEKT